MNYEEITRRLREDYSDHIGRIEALTMGMQRDRMEQLMAVIADMVGSRETDRVKYHHGKWLEHTAIISKIVGFPIDRYESLEDAIKKVLKHGSMDEIGCVLNNVIEAKIHNHLKKYSEQ